MYLNYSDYITMGGTLDETTFNEYAFEAEAEIDWYTFNRLCNIEYTNLDEKVKKCMYVLIKFIQDLKTAQAIPTSSGGTTSGIQAGILSQSNDGVSVSYATLSASEILKNSRAEIQAHIQKYLQGVRNELGRRVLYRGIYPGE